MTETLYSTLAEQNEALREENEKLRKDQARLDYVLSGMSFNHFTKFLYHAIHGKCIGKGNTPREAIDDGMERK